ncbi:MAG: hypothetical protein P8L39_16795 [Halioglobus sp.]|nr:hypothetical protein [Halioglobus sp.]
MVFRYVSQLAKPIAPCAINTAGALRPVDTLLKKHTFLLRWQCAARRQINLVLCTDRDAIKMPILAALAIFNYHQIERVAGVREASHCSMLSVQVAKRCAAYQESGADNKIKLHGSWLLKTGLHYMCDWSAWSVDRNADVF